MAREAQPLGDGSIVAAGGWCAPTKTLYDLGNVTHVALWSASNPPQDVDDDFYDEDDDVTVPLWTWGKARSITWTIDDVSPEVFDILTGYDDWDPSE